MNPPGRGRAVVARQAHNLKVAGSNPAPASLSPIHPKRTPCGSLCGISGLSAVRAFVIGEETGDFACPPLVGPRYGFMPAGVFNA